MIVLGQLVQVTSTDCWEWLGGKNTKGYGVASHPAKYKRAVLAHRLSYVTAHNLQLADIEGDLLMHTCDNPCCVNPAHLRVGTHQDNVADMEAKGRARKSTVSRNLGETCGTSVYTEELVRKMRAEVGLSVREIAAKYNLPRTSVSGIVHRHTWKHI